MFQHSICCKTIVLVVIISSVIQVTGKPLKPLSGAISGFTFSADTLYYITDEIIVPAEQRCHIPPGIVFLFGEAAKFTIEGTLTVDGQMENRVIFTSYNDKKANDSTRCVIPAGLIDWEGIHFAEGAENSAVRYLEIRHAEYPITSAIPYITGREVTIVECDKIVVLYKNNELSTSEFFKNEQNNPPEIQGTAITTTIPPQPEGQKPLPTPKQKWSTKKKIRVSLAFSTAAFTGAAIGAFIYANKHAENYDKQDAIASDTDRSNDERRIAENAAKREDEIANKFVGIGLVGTVCSLASLTWIGVTFLF